MLHPSFGPYVGGYTDFEVSRFTGFNNEVRIERMVGMCPLNC